jgi:voltage-gated potassium channel Kch
MLTPLQRGYRFMRGDASLTVAVVILSVYIFVLGPMAEIRQIDRLGLDVVFALFLAAGARFVFEPRAILRWFMTFLGLTVALRALDHFIDDRWLTAVSAGCSAISAFFLGALFLVRALRDGRVNSHRIMGAVGAFLLIGIIFAQAYRVITLFVPGAFSAGGTPNTLGDFSQSAVYFSFITLTSLGYGDIVPLHPLARSLATLEAVTGQLFLAILVARMVALEIEWRQEQRERQLAARTQTAGTRYPGD